jgi:hypothetical protein
VPCGKVRRGLVSRIWARAARAVPTLPLPSRS